MKDFLKIGDSEYRVEANWNAIAGFCRKKGVSDLSQLDVLVHIARRYLTSDALLYKRRRAVGKT